MSLGTKGTKWDWPLAPSLNDQVTEFVFPVPALLVSTRLEVPVSRTGGWDTSAGALGLSGPWARGQ